MSNNVHLMDRCLEKFGELQKATGKAKELVVKDMYDNHRDVFDVMAAVLNPMMTFGIGEKSINRVIDKPVTWEYSSLLSMLYELSNSSGISDQTIRNVQHFIYEHRAYQELLDGIVTKTIRFGVTAKTVNKVVGYKIIPEFECMLANKYFEHQDFVEGKSFALTEKLDGIRCLCIISDDGVKMFSRQGQLIEGLVDIEASAMQIHKRCGLELVLDGELLVTDRDAIPSKEQYKQTTKIVRADGVKHGITYNVFDIVEYDGFIEGQCRIPYYMRRQRLEVMVGHNLPCIRIVPILYSGDDTAQIQVYLDRERAAGHEGVMININDAVYEYKRTNVLLKCKVMSDCDLKITGIEEGSGKFAGTLGSLIVDYKGNPVGVGSGISDDLRQKIWANPNAYIGRVATVQYFEETQDKDGKLSIRFPVLKDIREAGKEVSYN